MDPRDRLTTMDHVRGWLSQRRWGAIGRWWRRRQRDADREILWPILVNKAFRSLPPDFDTYDVGRKLQLRERDAMALHMWLDKGWRFPDEWAGEPEAEWWEKHRMRIAETVCGVAPKSRYRDIAKMGGSDAK